MKIRPILMQTEMVQAVKAGRKTKTRRTRGLEDLVIDVDSGYVYNGKGNIQIDIHNWKEEILKFCPYGQVGDVLYVRETYYAYGHWQKNGATKTGKQKWRFIDRTYWNRNMPDGGYHYADKPPGSYYTIQHGYSEIQGYYKRPSLFMPKDAARIWLELVDVRVERLQDITEEDAISEGARASNKYTTQEELANNYNHPSNKLGLSYKAGFQTLWISINGEESWKANPFVWVLTFEVLSTTGKPENI